MLIMFLLPFLKYFKPFRKRLLIAVVCMILVGGLSTAPFLIAREAAKVLLIGGVGSAKDLEQLSGVFHGLISADMLKDAAANEHPGATPRAEAPKAREKRKAATSSLELKAEKIALYRQLRDRFLSLKEWSHDKIEPFNLWYQDKVRHHPLRALGFLATILIVSMFIKGISEFFSKYQLAYTFFLTNLRMREDILNNILRQDYLFFNFHAPGYLHSRINSDVNSIRSILESFLSDGVQQPITIVFMFIFLLLLNARLTFGVLIVMPVVGGLLYYFAKVLRRNTRKQKKKEDLLSMGLTESLNNIRLVKAFGTEDLEVSKFHARTLALFRYMMARRIAKFGASPLMEFLGSIAGSGVLLVGGWMIFQQQINFIDFLIYLFALTRFYRPLRSLAGINTKFQEASVSGERMLQMLRLEPKLVEHPQARAFNKLEREIELRHVDFCYKDKRVLEDISIKVPAGRRVALAGPSGGGKTTLVNMLARLFDPTEGHILVDGIDLREYSIADWRAHLAIVTQDTFLFDDTVENNIAYGLGAPDPERILAAARAANAHEFILQLDGGLGYKTMLGPCGGRLSGGQRQRLAIARAIYRNPKILILDEATSALDAHSQAIVQEALNRLMAGRTTFVIAHRISTIRDVDCIYVIDHGRIAESGTHDELLAQGGLYHAMVTKVGLFKTEALLDDSDLFSLKGPDDDEVSEAVLDFE